MRKLTIILSLISSITFAQSVNSLIGNWKLINYDKKSKIYFQTLNFTSDTTSNTKMSYYGTIVKSKNVGYKLTNKKICFGDYIFFYSIKEGNLIIYNVWQKDYQNKQIFTRY